MSRARVQRRQAGTAEPVDQGDVVDPREELAGAWQAEILAGIATSAAVRRLRATGASWHQVGLVVGYTAEGARRRWGPLMGELAD